MSQHPPASPSRRAVARGALWAAPVVAASAAVPAYASSQCYEFQSSFDSSWTADNPLSGTVQNPASNRIYVGQDGVSYYLMGTSATSEGGATIRYRGTISSRADGVGGLKTGCTYTVSFGISTLPAVTQVSILPAMTTYLLDPNGREVDGSRAVYSSDPALAEIVVPTAPFGQRSIIKRADGRSFSFTAQPGNYRWVTEIFMPRRTDTTTGAALGHSAPLFAL